MLGFYFSHPTRLAQICSGPLTPYIEALAERLHEERYHLYSARFILGQVGDCNQVFGWRGVDLGDLSVELFEEYRRHSESISPCRGLANSLDHLLRHLRADGALLPKAVTKNDSPFAQLLGNYSTWMREVQGLADSTIVSRCKLDDHSRILCGSSAPETERLMSQSAPPWIFSGAKCPMPTWLLSAAANPYLPLSAER